jgi:hypothetical protein
MQVDPESDETLPRARTARTAAAAARAHRAKFTGKMKQSRLSVFFVAPCGTGTLVVLADVSNDLDT